MIDKVWFLIGVILITVSGFVACFFALGPIGIVPVVMSGIGGAAFVMALMGGGDNG